MSGLDPLAAFALQAVANAQASLEEAAINLGSLVQDFKAQITVGDVLNATVLPPQNGTDRLLFLGQTIAAQLPPGINPGQTIALQVTGFTSTAILVRNLGVSDEAGAPGPASGNSLEHSAAPGVPSASAAELPPVVTQPAQRAILTSAPSTPYAAPGQARSQAASASPGSAQAPLPGAPRPVAPPREFFVAASVRQPDGVRTPAAPHAAAAGAPEVPADIEARIAAARTRSAVSRTPPSAPSADVRVRDVAPRTLARAPIAPSVVPAPSASARPTPEAVLLARLRVPISATTLAAARVVDDATRTMTRAFEKLDALLAKLPPEETSTSLRSTLAFVARFDLRNARTLPEQIAAYVSHVVTGAESKVAQIVRAWSDSVAETMTPSAAPEQGSDPPHQAPASAPAAQSVSAPLAAPVHPENPALVAARAAERDVALAHDVKSALLQLAASPPAGSSPQVVAALRDALTAATGVQLNALQAQSADPNVVTIPLPAYFYDGGAPAQLRIARDAPNAKTTIDADNFHIAFVLDTASLGTVAIDLTTVGRSVSVDVKAEAPRFAERFRSTLPSLRARLEQLHYRVATMAAATAPRGAAQPATPLEPAPSDGNVDLRA